MLSHPNYGGAYVYGRREATWGGVRQRPRERWHALIPESHEGYVSWERFERVRETLAANGQRGDGAGAPKRGAAVRTLVRTCTDDVIAGALNRGGLRTGRGNRWTRERVTSLRSRQGIPCHDPQTRRADGWMNLTEAAAELGVSPRTLRLAAERGDVAAEHPLPEGPWVFNRTALRDDGAVALAARARRRSGSPAIPDSLQNTLDFSTT